MLQQINGYRVSTPANNTAQVSFAARQIPTAASMSRADIVNFLHLDALVKAGEKVELPRQMQELCEKMTGAKKVTDFVLHSCAEYLTNLDPSIKNVADTVANTVRTDKSRSLNTVVLDKCKLKLKGFMNGPVKIRHFKLDKAAAKAAEEAQRAKMLEAQGVTIRNSAFTVVEPPPINVVEKYAGAAQSKESQVQHAHSIIG